MRGVKISVMLLAVFVGFSTIALAQEPGQAKAAMMGQVMEKGKMKKFDSGCAMMKEMMLKRQLVVTEDGGVVVMTGNKLIKFDKDLNLIKEVTLEIDFEAMHKMMEKMREKRAMLKEMAGKDAEEAEQLEDIEDIEPPEEALE